MPLIDAILWKWPDAKCIIRGDALERWDGPGDCPSKQAIAAAKKGYAAVEADVVRDQCMARDLNTTLARTLVRLVADATKTDPADVKALCVEAYKQEWAP